MSLHRLTFRSVLLAAAASLPLLTCGALAGPVASEAADKTPRAVWIELCFVRSTPAQARQHPQLRPLLEAGGMVFAAPRIQTQDNMAGEFKSVQQYPYMGKSGGKDAVSWVEVGVRCRVVPHCNPNGIVQLDVDVTNSEFQSGPAPKPGKLPIVERFGLFNSKLLPLGRQTVMGTWMQQGKIVTVYASVTIPNNRVQVQTPAASRK